MDDLKEYEAARQATSSDSDKIISNRVYIMKIIKFIDDGNRLSLYKIGKSSGKNSVDRMLQLMRSHFMSYRYSPFITIKRDRATDDAFGIENKLHKKFKDCKYYFDKPIDGKEEYFVIDREDELLKFYDELIPKKKGAK